MDGLDIHCNGSTAKKHRKHHTMKIESFSSLNTMYRYESTEFEAGGYKWKLVLFPNGNKDRDVDDHISFYLEMSGKKKIKSKSIVMVDYKLFLLNRDKERNLVLEDQKHCIYRTIVGGLAGFDRFIRLEDFNDADNGYLINDKCEFGVEVFVSKWRRGTGEHLYMNLHTVMHKHVWTVHNFSKSNAGCLISKPFIAGDQNYCRLRPVLYPKGRGIAKGIGYLSLFLHLDKPNTYLPSGSKVLVDYTLRVLDQFHGRYHSHRGECWLSSDQPNCGYGFYKFITREANARFLKNDSCIFEAKITIRGIILPQISTPLAGAGWFKRRS